MYVLESYDWFGPIEELNELDKKLKKHFDGKHGVEFLGRFAPQQTKFHWTHFYKVKDWKAWVNHPEMEYKRDYKVHTHGIVEYYV